MAPLTKPSLRAPWRAAALIAGLLAAAVPPAARAQANEFRSTARSISPTPSWLDNICDADPGLEVRCTLRAAVMQANVTPGRSHHPSATELYRLTIPGAGEDQGRTGDLDLVGRITIIGTNGGGRNRTIVDATGLNDRVFDGRSNAATLQGLTISGGALGTTTGTSTELDGGGIRNGGNLTVLDSVVQQQHRLARRRHRQLSAARSRSCARRSSDNSATAGDTGLVADGGGGIFSINNTFTLRDSTVQNNTSAFDGGGITLAPIFFPQHPNEDRSLR